jgi:hypothetical protein
MKRAGMEKFFVQWCLSDMILNICTCLFYCIYYVQFKDKGCWISDICKLIRLLAITAFPGFVYVFNNSYFWLWYSRLWTCDIFIAITKWSYFLIQIPLFAQSVTDSSRNNHNIPQLVQDEGCPVKFYDWKTFLKQFFKPLSSLTTYNHFRADKESPQ